jgi:hypothetical protein
MANKKYLVSLILLLHLCNNLVFSQLNHSSPNYTIPSYYGSRYLDAFYYKSVIESNLSSLYWNGGFETDLKSKKSWFVDSSNHLI